MKLLDCKDSAQCSKCEARLGLEQGDVFLCPEWEQFNRSESYFQCANCKYIQRAHGKKISPVRLEKYLNRSSVIEERIIATVESARKTPSAFVVCYVVLEYKNGQFQRTHIFADFFEANKYTREFSSRNVRVGDDCDRLDCTSPVAYLVFIDHYRGLSLSRVTRPEPPEHYGLAPYEKLKTAFRIPLDSNPKS